MNGTNASPYDDAEPGGDAPGDDGAGERIGMMVAGRYRLVRVLGAGGMGAVYEAEHEALGKRVALKTLHREYARDKSIIERFQREARAATAIGDEHIVDVTDLGVLPDGAPFLVMEMLKGCALAELLRAEAPLPIGRAVRIVRQICQALAACHEKGIVHRDLKPDNVFLTPRDGNVDFVKVLDFGISKMHQTGEDRGLTQTGMALGTPSYMSPEQAQGSKDVDGRTDVWALGVMLYEMLAGVRPFDGSSFPMLLVAIVTADPAPLATHRRDVPAELDALVLRCLEKPVEHRVPSMRALHEALARFERLGGAPALVSDPPPAPAAAGNEDRTRAPLTKPTVPEGGRVPVATTPEGTRVGERAAPDAVPADAGPADAGPRDALPRDAGPRDALPRDAGPPDAGRRDAAPADAPERTRVGPASAIAVAPRAELASVAAAVAPESATTKETTAPPSRALLLGAAGVAAVLAIGVALAMGQRGTPEEGDPVRTPAATPAPAAPPAAAVSPAPVAVEAPPAAPAEVRIRIRATPADARIRIGDVEFPNPMDAPRPRSLDPIRIRIEAEGHEPLERLLVLDEDLSVEYALARTVRTSGRRLRVGGATDVERGGGAASPPATGGRGDGFRDDF